MTTNDLPAFLRFTATDMSFRSADGSTIDVLRRFTWSIPNSKPQIVAIVGPSGCGKSTILDLLAGLMSPVAGEVMLLGKPVNGPARDTILVGQQYTCFPWLTVSENVEFGLSLVHVPKRRRLELAQIYLEKVGLSDRAQSYPQELSGSMRQRVAIARTLVMKPKVILTDEPFGALDAITRQQMQDMLVSLWRTERFHIVFVTHDISEAIRIATRVAVLPMWPISKPVEEFHITEGVPRDDSSMAQTELHDIRTKITKHLMKRQCNMGGQAE